MRDRDHLLPGVAEVSLFGTIIHQTDRAYRFAAEDQGKGEWIAKSIASWDGVVMTMPRWLARKHGWIRELLPDNHPAWAAVLKPGPIFVALTLLVDKSHASLDRTHQRPPHQPRHDRGG